MPLSRKDGRSRDKGGCWYQLGSWELGIAVANESLRVVLRNILMYNCHTLFAEGL